MPARREQPVIRSVDTLLVVSLEMSRKTRLSVCDVS